MKFLPRFARDQVLNEQLRLVKDNYLSGTIGLLIVCGALTVITYRATEDIRAIIWFIALALHQAFWSVQHRRTANISQRTPRQIATIEVFKVLASNVIFCYFLVIFMVEASPPVVVISAAIATGGLTSGSLAGHGPCLPIFYSYTLPKMLVAITALVLLGGDNYLLLAYTMMLYLFIVYGFARKIDRNIESSIELRFENQDLVEKLRATLTEADEANKAKSVFLSSASHDLRQPLHALALMVEVMAHSDLDPQLIELQDNMMSAVNSTRDMLDSLLNMSKLEAGAISANPTPFLIQTIFDRVDAEMRQSADQKMLNYRARKTNAAANSDIGIVELILRNLISNAIRYTNSGGVLIACRKRRPNTLLIEVWDTGIGIQETKTEEIFRPFHQLGNPERDSVKGFGLGLAITQKLAETIGTTISLKSVAGRGSVFQFKLPLAHSAAIPARIIENTDISFVGRSVLVIEDNLSARVTTQALVAGWGFSCISADSAADALSQLKNKHHENASIDIILVDYRLRDNLTGWDAIKEIRQFIGTRIPAIIITGDTAPERIKEATNADAHLMHKPISVKKLKQLMNHILTSS